jgi:hypothetical protein
MLLLLFLYLVAIYKFNLFAIFQLKPTDTQTLPQISLIFSRGRGGYDPSLRRHQDPVERKLVYSMF